LRACVAYVSHARAVAADLGIRCAHRARSISQLSKRARDGVENEDFEIAVRVLARQVAI
jgi:hypothetical protein